MTRRILVALAAGLLAACGPNVPRLTDPAEILDAAATNAEAATSVHIDVSVEGTLTVSLLGGSGSPIDLSETTASADLDLETGDLTASFAIPAILNLSGDITVIGTTAYFRTSMTGQDYQTTTLSTAPGALLDGVIGLLRTPGLDTTLGADEPCAGGTCYAVSFDVTPEQLATIGGALPIPDLPVPLPDLSTATIRVTVLVEQSTQRLAGLRVAIAGEGIGDLTVEATFTKWDEPLTIEVPEGATPSG